MSCLINTSITKSGADQDRDVKDRKVEVHNGDKRVQDRDRKFAKEDVEARDAAQARGRAKIGFDVIIALHKRSEGAADEFYSGAADAAAAAKLRDDAAILRDDAAKLRAQEDRRERVANKFQRMAVSKGLSLGQSALKELVEDGQTKMADDHKKVVDGQTALLRTARKARNIDHVKEEQKYADNETLILDQIDLLNYQLGQLNDKLEQARTNHADYLVEWNAAETPPPAAVSTNVTTVSTMKLSRAPTVGLCGSPSAVNPNPQ